MKKYSVILMDDAVDDLVRGANFYRVQLPELANLFLDSLMTDITSLESLGGVHNRHFVYHRFLSKRLPSGVYYEISENSVRIVAVLDLRQNPEGIGQALSIRSLPD